MSRPYRTLLLLAAISLAIGDSFASTLSSVAGATATTAAGSSESDNNNGQDENGDDDGLAGPHGIMGVIAFMIMFPLGSMIIRLLQNGLWKHAGWMLLTYVLALATLFTGIVLAQDRGQLDEGHSLIGVLVIVGLFLQPFTGYIHHKLFVKTGGRTAVSYAHMWIGIPLITLGIVNGLFGLKLADKETYELAIYAIVAALIWVIWIASSVWAVRRRKRQVQNNNNAVRMGKL